MARLWARLVEAVENLEASFLEIISVIVGIISAAIKEPLGLATTNWFLLTIIFFLWGMSFWSSAYFGAKEGYSMLSLMISPGWMNRW